MLPLRTLCHYTTREGFEGILTSKCIWASEVRFLNDVTEFRTALDAVATELRSRLEDLDSSDARRRAEDIFRDLNTLEEADYFVTCLSEKADDLNQWRAYGGTHTGFALGFDLQRLRTVASERGFELDRCLYEPIEHSLLAATIIDAALAWPSEGKRMSRRRRREFRRTMSQLGPFLKNHHFRSESEWRLVFVSTQVSPPSSCFRNRSDDRIPYCNFPLFASDGSSPLCGIIIGPTPDFGEAERWAANLLNSRGLGDTPIHRSAVPLRTWKDVSPT